MEINICSDTTSPPMTTPTRTGTSLYYNYSKIRSKKYLATIAAIPTCVDQCAFFQYVFADKSMLL